MIARDVATTRQETLYQNILIERLPMKSKPADFDLLAFFF